MNTVNLPVIKAEAAYRSQSIRQGIRAGRPARDRDESAPHARSREIVRRLRGLTHLMRPAAGARGR